MAKIVILGLGMQGKAALFYLLNNCPGAQIVVVDNGPEFDRDVDRYLSDTVSGCRIDASDEMELAPIIEDADVVMDALPGSFALYIAKLAARMGVNLVSAMYYLNPAERDPIKIKKIREELYNINIDARETGAIVLSEFGFDPGIDLVMGKKALSEVDVVEEFYSYGAGLPAPEAANNPLKYKFSWSVIGVMRAYLRPAWIISKGQVVNIESKNIFAGENVHLLQLDELPTALECYPNGNSVYYAELFGIKNTVRETARFACRWPGHCAFWEVMSKSGFLDDRPIDVEDTLIPPIDFTATLLGSQKQFRYNEDEKDMTLIRIDVRGSLLGKKKRVVYQLIDWRDLNTGFTSMQRTAGFTMGLGARLIMGGRLNKAGLLTPLDVPYDLVVKGLEKHGIHITRREFPWE